MSTTTVNLSRLAAILFFNHTDPFHCNHHELVFCDSQKKFPVEDLRGLSNIGENWVHSVCNLKSLTNRMAFGPNDSVNAHNWSTTIETIKS